MKELDIHTFSKNGEVNKIGIVIGFGIYNRLAVLGVKNGRGFKNCLTWAKPQNFGDLIAARAWLDVLNRVIKTHEASILKKIKEGFHQLLLSVFYFDQLDRYHIFNVNSRITIG